MSKKKISVMNGKRFVAAYSKYPFEEAEGRVDQYPDYVFCGDGKGKEGLYWCVRYGRIEIPWGITFRNGECSANGSLFVSRERVNEIPFYGEGLPFVKERVGDADVWYLYESEFTGDGFIGFSVYMRECLLPYIRLVAEEMGVEGFRDAVKTASDCAFMKKVGFRNKLEEHHLILKDVIVNDVREKNAAQ